MGTKDFGRLTISTLDMRPLGGSKPKHKPPFTVLLYVDMAEGSYVSFGRFVHRTIMWHAKKKPPQAPLCAWDGCENVADPARPGSGPFDNVLCAYHDEIQEGDPPFVPEHPLTNPTEENM